MYYKTLFSAALLCMSAILSAITTAHAAIPAAEKDAGYAGYKACAGCHESETLAWQGSHHALAMQTATQATVLGDFDDARFEHYGITSRFYRSDEAFMVKTEGPDGALHDYQVAYTFGVYPLQQYLVQFPGGRLQALDIAWDSRNKEEGGQRWIALHPNERIPAGDVLHWTGPNLNWNYMCAECHSTGLNKNYDAESRSYATTWSEINVSCEACHGPAATHVDWAQRTADGDDAALKDTSKGLAVLLDEREGVSWKIDGDSGKPVRSVPRTSSVEIQTCAVCHSRRSQIAEDSQSGKPFFDSFMPSLLTEGLYHADGQIEDEVYVYGSFLQSKMHAAGVTCSDCHDPHKAGLRLPGEQVCYQCHEASRYTKTEHHFHVPGSTGASCVECHMPAQTYMVVDPRHDHSFRIPRPDLSVKLGTPNACNACHTDKTPLWAAEQVKTWYGDTPSGYQQFAGTLKAARNASPGAGDLLKKLASDAAQPGIARATSASYLGRHQDVTSFGILKTMTDSEDPMQRLAALQALADYDLRNRVQLVFPLLDDPVRSVRVQAAGLLASVPAGNLAAGQQDILDRAMQEYVEVQLFNAERPEAQLNLGTFYADQGNERDAEAAYREALRLQPQFVPAYVNLAQLYSGQGDETAALEILQSGLEAVKDSAVLYHALGLAQVRSKQAAEAMASLSRAAELDQGNARYSYVYAVGLQSSGDTAKAIDVLEIAHGRHPGDADILYTLVIYLRDAGRIDAARRYLSALKKLAPGNSAVMQLEQELRSQ